MCNKTFRRLYCTRVCVSWVKTEWLKYGEDKIKQLVRYFSFCVFHFKASKLIKVVDYASISRFSKDWVD